MKIYQKKIINSFSSTLSFLICLFLFSQVAFAQSDKKLIREGNELYKNKKYSEAEVKYRKSLQENHNNTKANYNLGTSLYKQGNYDKAAEEFQSYINKDNDKDKIARAYHNLGNSYLQNKKYAEGIEAYKQALKHNPVDMDTKYNLAYAQQMLRQQQQQQQNNKDKKNQDKQDQNKDKQNQNEQQQKQKEQKISKEDAERLLQALQNDEKELQKKLKRLKPSSIKTEKNW